MHTIPRGEAIRTEFEQNCHTVNLREDGVTLVRGLFRYPTLPRRNLYKELADACENWLRSELVSKAAQEYADDPSTKKRFFFPSYEYRFEVTQTGKNEKTATFRLTVTLSRRRAAGLLSKFEDVAVFRLDDLMMLPQKKKR